jgi:hypothetical protein
MKAQVGDRIVIEGTHVGEPRRSGTILEIHGKDGAPPYLVEWKDEGHTTVFIPGPDARLRSRATR